MASMSVLLFYEFSFLLSISIIQHCGQAERGANTNSKTQLAFDDGFTESNRWRTFDNWNCNTPPAMIEGFQIAAVSNSNMGHFTDKTSGVLLFGGLRDRREESAVNDTWFFDTEEQLWSKIETKTNPPPRRNHIMISLCNDMVVLLGGKPVKRHLNKFYNDVWIFNITRPTWTEVKVRGEHPPQSVYESTTAVLPLRDNQCKCNQSIILTEKRDDWTNLWTLHCLQEQHHQYSYTWMKLRGNDVLQSPTNIPFTVLAPEIGITYGLTKTSLWECSSVNTSWNRIHTTNLLRRPNVTRFEIMAYLSIEKDLVLFSTINRTLLAHQFLNQSAFRWRTDTAVGNMPMPLHNVHESSTTTKYRLAVVGSTIVAYGGATTGCEQFTWILRQAQAKRIWSWTRIPDSPLEPKKIENQTVAMIGANLYVYGYSQGRENQAQMWRTELQTMQWWQLRRGRFPLLNGGSAVGMTDLAVLVFCSPIRQTGFHPTPVATETWIYSINSTDWIQVPTPQTIQNRQRYSLTEVDSTTILLFGGKSTNQSTTAFNDVWMLSLVPSNLSESNWQQIVWQGKGPKARFGHSAVIWNSGLAVFGGQSSNRSCFTDLWHFDVQQHAWNQLAAQVPTKANPVSCVETDCFSSSTRVGDHILVITGGGCDKTSPPTNASEPSDRYRHPTWLYIHSLNTWELVSWISGVTINAVTAFTFEPYVFISETASSFRLHFILPRCPGGLVSSDLYKTPCKLCERGTYSNENKTNCNPCPTGTYSSKLGATAPMDCNSCAPDACDYGICYIEYRDKTPSPVCHCHIGFSGTKCNFPTYYLIVLTVSIVLSAAIVIACIFIRIVKRKRRRENELTRQVLELTSVWQIRYEELTIQNRVGAGGYGVVFKALYREMTVAVKFLHYSNDQILLEFEREIRLMQTMRHPNIVMFIGAGKSENLDKQPFLVAEYMQRGSLRDVLDDKTMTLTLSRRIQFALDAATAMTFLHNLVPSRVHNDLKSDNMLVSGDWVVKLSDFGLGVQLQSSAFRKSRGESITSPLLADNDEMENQQLGAIRWRAPELTSQQNYGTAADVYSFGIVLWEIWSRQLPFIEYPFDYQVHDAVQDGQRPVIPDTCPIYCAQLMKDCWKQMPHQRPPFSEIKQKLLRFSRITDTVSFEITL